MKKTLSLLMIAAAVIFSGCKKEAPEPEKPVGNAELVTKYKDVSTWNLGCNNTCFYSQTIDGDVSNEGSVVAYMQTPSTEWEALPIVAKDYIINYEHAGASIKFTVKHVDGINLSGSPGAAKFKYVITRYVK